MKKIIPIFLLLIIIFPAVSAIDIDMNSNIPKGETVIASVSGNFFDPITKDNIYFYRGHVRTAFDYDVAKIGDNYYIYFQTANKAENDYSINITGVRYYVGSQISSSQISKAFTITNETADFSVTPGFVITNGNFSIKIQNLQSLPITVNLDTEIDSGSSDGFFGFLFNEEDAGQSISLQSGQIKILYVNLKDIYATTIRTIKLSTENTVYNVQCYVILENNSSPTPEENNASTSNETNNTTNNQTNTSENNETNNTSNFNQTNTTVNNETGTSNNVNKTNCSFFGILFGTCKANQTTSNGTVNNKTNQTSNNTNVDYEVVKIGNKTVAVKNGTILNESATSKTCAQIKGYICLSGEICQNTTIYAKDAKCCISQCVKEEQATNTKLIGWVIVGIIVIIILRFFMVKFKKMKKKSDPLLNHGKR